MGNFYNKHRNLIWLAAIILLALGCRVIRYYECDLLERDTFNYLKIARSWAAGGMAEGYKAANGGDVSVPPLLPGIMAWGEKLGIGALNAGLWFNLLAGALIPLALYLICCAVFEDRRFALWAALLGAIHPYTLRLSALIMRDTPYLAAVLFAVACGVWAAKTHKIRYWLLFAVCAVAASLLRKEGPELIFLFCCWGVWSLWQNRNEWRTELVHLLKAGLAMAVIFLVCTLPLQIYLSRHSDCSWQVSNERRLIDMYQKIVKADMLKAYEKNQR